MSFPLRSLTLSKRPELDRSNHHPRERPRATARHCRKVYCHRKRVGRTQLSELLDRYGLVLSLPQRTRKSRLYLSHRDRAVGNLVSLVEARAVGTESVSMCRYRVGPLK